MLKMPLLATKENNWQAELMENGSKKMFSISTALKIYAYIRLKHELDLKS